MQEALIFLGFRAIMYHSYVSGLSLNAKFKRARSQVECDREMEIARAAVCKTRGKVSVGLDSGAS